MRLREVGVASLHGGGRKPDAQIAGVHLVSSSAYEHPAEAEQTCLGERGDHVACHTLRWGQARLAEERRNELAPASEVILRSPELGHPALDFRVVRRPDVAAPRPLPRLLVEVPEVAPLHRDGDEVARRTV